VKALAAAAKAVGFAHVTAQAAVDAGNAAVQVAKPADDAIQLGSPYVTTDSAASLVALTGQASKTIADQQRAVADVHAQNAQAEATTAPSIADQASGDAKLVYQYAANAAGHAVTARGYSKEALGYTTDAAAAAAKTAASLACTVECDRKAAGRAEGARRERGPDAAETPSGDQTGLLRRPRSTGPGSREGPGGQHRSSTTHPNGPERTPTEVSTRSAPAGVRSICSAWSMPLTCVFVRESVSWYEAPSHLENIWLRTKRYDANGKVRSGTGGVCYVYWPARPTPDQRHALQALGLD
jgi:hypothetical protein